MRFASKSFKTTLFALTLSALVLSWVGPASQANASKRLFDVIPSGFTAISTGDQHTCALTNAGGVKCWGANDYGQLGDGTNLGRLTPVDVSGLTFGVTAIDAGSYHTCAVTNTGAVKCWGANDSGQLGNSSYLDSNIPVNVSGLTSGITAVSAGETHTCALTSAGGIKCWGLNLSGNLGNGSNTPYNTPVDVIDLYGQASAVSAGSWFTCALLINGPVKCWGENSNYQVGDGTLDDKWSPVNVSGLAGGAASILAGYFAGSVVTSGGVKWWGTDLIRSSIGIAMPVPETVAGLETNISAFTSGAFHACALTLGGGLLCLGTNDYGQLGNGSDVGTYDPVGVTGLSSGVAAVSAGYQHTCAITTDGLAKCWGQNNFGQVGDGTTTTRFEPVNVSITFPPAAFDKTGPADAGYTDTTPTLSWTASARASGYEVCYATTTAACTNWTSAWTAASLTLPPLASGTRYFWQVRAINTGGVTYADGSSLAYRTFTTTLPATPSYTPTGTATPTVTPTATPTSTATATQTETPTATQTGTATVTRTQTPTATQTGTATVTRTQTPDATHTITPTITSTVTLTVSPSPGFRPGPFSRISPANGGMAPANASLKWGPATGAQSYEYCLMLYNDPCTMWTNVGAVTSVIPSGLINGRNYYWQVRAINQFGASYGNGIETVNWSFKVDGIKPTVTAISRLDPNPSTAASLRFRVVFSEAVSGVDKTDFSLTTSGLTGAVVSSVAGTGTTYTVTTGTGTGFGTLRLNVLANGSIKDAAGNPLAGAFTGGPKYTLDRNNQFISAATLDGWTLESSETSSLGGAFNSSGLFYAGDDALNRQYRSILSFNTSGLPDNAVIIRVTLKIRKAGLAGTDPFITHGLLLADVRSGFFGGLANLEAQDFQALASKAAAGNFAAVTAVPGLYQMILPSTNFVYINKLGNTQFRLRFALDDNNDRGADTVSFFAGDYLANPGLRPLLVVDYLLP